MNASVRGVQFCDLVMGDFHTFFERSAKGNRKVNVRLIKIVLSCVALLNLDSCWVLLDCPIMRTWLSWGQLKLHRNVTKLSFT